VVATGSSALRIGAGSRESLAGRFEKLVLSHWSASALTESLGVERADAAQLFVQLGSYPGALRFRSDLRRFKAYVRDAIAEPAIGKDVLAHRSIRRPALLRQVFALATTLPAQIVSLQKLQGRLMDSGALETIAHYLQLLEEAYLVAAVEKFSTSALRRRKAPPKIVVLNNALMAALDPAGIPDPGGEPARFGSWVENACLAHAWNSGQEVAYWREEPLEVDAVLRGSWGDWAIEVKTGLFEASELRGLLEFCRRYPRFQPLVLCGSRGETPARRAGVPSMRWEQFLLGQPRRAEKR
jgi:predicted AAA+ superfamily ATPase